MECWSNGVMKIVELQKLRHPALHYSITPFSDGDHDVTAASRPVKAFVPVRIRLVTPFGRVQTLRWAEVDRLSSTNKEGVPSVAKAVAVCGRVLTLRFPAWNASVRSRHLPI